MFIRINNLIIYQAEQQAKANHSEQKKKHIDFGKKSAKGGAGGVHMQADVLEKFSLSNDDE